MPVKEDESNFCYIYKEKQEKIENLVVQGNKETLNEPIYWIYQIMRKQGRRWANPKPLINIHCFLTAYF